MEAKVNKTVPIPVAIIFLLVGITAGFLIGQKTAQPQGIKIATAEKGEVLLEALLSRPNASQQTLEIQVERPIQKIYQHYSDNGWLVLNTSKDEDGNICIDALPKGKTRDITQELRNAVQPAKQQ